MQQQLNTYEQTFDAELDALARQLDRLQERQAALAEIAALLNNMIAVAEVWQRAELEPQEARHGEK